MTPDEAIPAATAILVRDVPLGDGRGHDIEVLVLRRDTSLVFAGGMWVFPGGRVDPSDTDPASPEDSRSAARRAAVREIEEEAGLVVDPATLVPWSHWTPPPVVVRRFATWFFVAPAPAGPVSVDHGEITAHRWERPARMLQLQRAGEIELAPPTWITLAELSAYDDAAGVLAAARAKVPAVFVTRIALAPEGPVALYAGDAGYESADASLAGGRHRLWMSSGGWSYQRPDGFVVGVPPPGE